LPANYALKYRIRKVEEKQEIVGWNTIAVVLG
jgi:hypothetical protein